MFYFNLFNPNGFFYIQQPPRDEKKCPNCGLSSTELFTKGKIGCSQCAETFQNELETIILHIQGRNKFSGRVPQSLAQENAFNIEEVQEKLKLAIEEERYEDAATYRDLIRSHEGA